MNGFVITAAGQELLAATLAGETLTITRVSMGSGKVPDGQDPTNFTALIAPVAEGTSTLPIVESSTVSLIVEYRNDLGGGLESGFSICEFGVFARTATRPEALLYYASLGEYPQWVGPLAAGLETRRFPIRVAVSNDADVTLAYPAGAFVTAEEFETQLSKKVTIHAVNEPGLDCNELLKDGRYQMFGQVLNAPPWIGAPYGHFFVDVFWHMDVWVRQVAYRVDGPGMFTRQSIGGYWTKWEPIATATPPQEFDLPLAAGYAIQSGYKSCFSKAQNGLIVLHVAVRNASGENLAAGYHNCATIPVGYWPSGGVGHSSADRSITVQENGNVALWIATARESVIFTVPYYAATYGPIAHGAPVRMAAARSARMAISEEPINKCFCVVDADGAYQELVLVTIAHDELGALYTPHYYSLADGEQLVDTQYPTTRPHAGADGFILPRWDFDGQVWTESATFEEIAAWEAEHPAPEPSAPSASEQMRADVDFIAAMTGVTL